MIKFKLYSESTDTPMNILANKLSSVSLGSTKFIVNGKSIKCGFQDDIKGIDLQIILRMDDTNTLRSIPVGSAIPDNEPNKSYSSVLLDLINALDGLGYNEALEFINKLSKKG